MNRQGHVAVIALAALLVGLGSAACDPENDWLATQAAIPVNGEGAPGIGESVDASVIAFLTENDLPGATVAVTRGGRLVWSKSYGWAKRSEQLPMQPWHRSRIGSVSKVITTIGLLQMLEEPGPALGSLAAPGGGSLPDKLAQKVYGYPGSDFDSPQWPTVTGATVLDDPEIYWEAIREGVQLTYPDTYETDMARMIDWASRIELGHLLSHTSGLPRSGSAESAAAYYGIDESLLVPPQVHLAVLAGQIVSAENSANVRCYLDGSLYVHKDDPDYTGQTYRMPALLFEPGTKECYSNHGFGLIGYIMKEWSGPLEADTYEQIIYDRILEPLGLTDVVPKNTDISDLDAHPHGSSLNPDDPADSTATGGWTATAQDMVRIMCGVDRDSNHLRLLEPETTTVMETVAYPEASDRQPLGWDSRNGQALVKDGVTRGGASRIAKFLPGEFGETPDEINVAVNVNSGAEEPTTQLLRGIAQQVAAADIPDDYDLFNPAYACVVEPEPGIVNPTLRPSTPGASTLVNPTPTTTVTVNPRPTTPPVPTTAGPGTLVIDPPATRTPRIPPTVTIHLPYNGWQPAPNRVAQIPFEGEAVDANGNAIPGTRMRWTAIEGNKSTVLCVGSAFGPAPTTTGGFVNPADCTSFTRQFTNPVSGSGPSITIRLEARDQSGLVGSTEVVIALYTPPAR